MNVGVFSNPYEDVSYIVGGIISFLNRKVKNVWVDKDGFPEKRDEEFIIKNSNIIIVVGGDGTMLHICSKILSMGRNLPVVGINKGKVGFLTAGNSDETEEILRKILKGDYREEKKYALRCFANGRNFYALNEFLVSRYQEGKIIETEIFVNGERVGVVRGDGVIVSTELGSTAYSLAVGGPIIYPGSGVILISFLAPYSLSVRPIVVPYGSEIEIKSSKFLLFGDGKKLGEYDKVKITKSNRFIRVIKVKKEEDFFSLLREKLKFFI